MRIALIPALLLVLPLASAQDGASTAGLARTRRLGNLGLIPSPREVVVEDFVNYHRHEIGRPKAGEAVHMDVRWGRGGVLQVGLSTALANDRAQLKPLNLALVIDKSGSMASADKMGRVKQALQTFVGKLRETDTLSIVTFDSGARVLVPSQPLRDRAAVREAIEGIRPGSATNLDAGLRLGYQEALKGYRKGATNRVILLTDGIANQGETQPEKIAAASLGFNDRGVDLSTIGVGQDLNGDLLRKLAKSGRGLYHFVADDGDIGKVFDKEAQSLVSPVATSPSLHIEFSPGLRLDKVYGYEPTLREHAVDVELDNMNRGMTEVVLLKFLPGAEKGSVKVRLAYHDLERGKEVVKREAAALTHEDDPSVAKNATIARLAQAIHDMAALAEKGDALEARGVLDDALAEARRRYPNAEDEDVARVLATAEKYRAMLGGETTRNLLPNGDFALGNRGFTSDLPYVAPGDNVLWPAAYTVAPRFDSPNLHRLIAPGAYSAPSRPTGREQVLYANAGGTGGLTVWSSEAPRKAHARYLIRFKWVSLTGGGEWMPSFAIEVNGTRPPVQSGKSGGWEETSVVWDSDSGSDAGTTAQIRIVRLPMAHNGGLIAIANVEMIEL